MVQALRFPPEQRRDLYFCGHGLERSELLLLPEDFGRHPSNPWITAVDFDLTFRAMEHCQAQTQCYFLDNCRQRSPSLDEETPRESSLIPERAGQPTDTAPRNACWRPRSAERTLLSTGDVSRYTKALIDSLSESAAEYLNGFWVVHTDKLGTALQRLVEQRNQNLEKSRQQTVEAAGGSIGRRTLHILPPGAVPHVTVICSCKDDEVATSEAEFWARRAQQTCRAQAPGHSSLDIEAGYWDFGADFSTGHYSVRPEVNLYCDPPVCDVKLEVQHG